MDEVNFLEKARESYDDADRSSFIDFYMRDAEVCALISIAENLAKLAELAEKGYRDEHIHDRIMP